MWERIRANKRKSILLVAILAALLMGIGAAIGGQFGSVWIGVAIAFGVWLVMTLVAWFGGSSMVLWASKVKPVTHADAPQLFNVVEEMSIASGLPMPKVYIIDDTAPNAFATGRTPEKASIAVTKGLVDKLSRNELQGVIAHEMAHIRNRDILFMTLVGILVGTIVLICDIYLHAMWFGAGRRRRSTSRKGGGGEAILMIVALVLAILTPFIARLLYLAISRRREYLADASATELTRYPEGLASALEKISGDKEVLEVANRATAHLYIVNPIKPFEERYSHMRSTHPPIKERVAILRRMAGAPQASLDVYESTRRAVGAGPRRAIAGKRTLKEAEARPVAMRGRARTGTRSPEELRADLENMIGPGSALGGLYFLLCACGAPVPIPGGAGALGIFQCTSCGNLHDTRKGAAGLKHIARDGSVETAPAEAEGEAAPAPSEAPAEKPKAEAPAEAQSEDSANPFGVTFDESGDPVFPPKASCPHCGREFDFPEGFNGSRGPCPNCRKMIVFFGRR